MRAGAWRYLEDDGVPASFGLAADEYLLGLAGEGVAALRLYTYRNHAALVGQFQNVEAELRLDECRRLGAEVNRRLTGGGAIVMGEGQLGLALTLPPEPGPLHPAALFARYASPVIAGLRSLGVEATFRPKNDIEVEGRKIAGLGIYVAESGALLFHASILVDLDVALMLRLLNLTPEKISDKHIAAFEERLTTVRRCTGRPVSTAEVREALRTAFESELGARLEPRRFSAAEVVAVREVERRRYLGPEWVYARTPSPDATGHAVLKTAAGLLRVYVSLAGPVIRSALITGDFFAESRALRDLEARLKWSAASPQAIAAAVDGAWAPEAPVWGLPPDALRAALVDAVADARANAPQREADLVQP